MFLWPILESKPPGPVLQQLQSLNEGCLYTLAQTSGAFQKHRTISVWFSLQSQVIKRSRNKPLSNPGDAWCWGKREGEEEGRSGERRWKWEKDTSRSSPDPKPSLGLRPLMEKPVESTAMLPHNSHRPLPALGEEGSVSAFL